MIRLAKAFIFSATLAVSFASPPPAAAFVELYRNDTANFPWAEIRPRRRHRPALQFLQHGLVKRRHGRWVD